MKNRIVSLFDLDDLLRAGHNGHDGPARKRRSGKAARKKPSGSTPTPAPHAARKKQKTGGAVAYSFDKGDPIRCQHEVTYKPVAPVDVEVPAPPARDTVAQQLGDEYDVEAFEEPDEEKTLRLADLEEETRDATRISLSNDQSSEASPAESLSAESQPRHHPATFAADMEAVERGLADLATRSGTPTPALAAPDERTRDDDTSPSAPAPPVPGHAVFDQMAQGMNYATEFRLPAVQLSQVFSALDRQLDAEQDHKAGVAPAYPPATAYRPAAPAVEIVPPGSDTLIKDLVALPVPTAGEAAVVEPSA
ncbi:MAG: hypothetical protein ACT4P7_00015 [Gemmatimonadaceae bacterium]